MYFTGLFNHKRAGGQKGLTSHFSCIHLLFSLLPWHASRSSVLLSVPKYYTTLTKFCLFSPISCPSQKQCPLIAFLNYSTCIYNTEFIIREMGFKLIRFSLSFTPCFHSFFTIPLYAFVCDKIWHNKYYKIRYFSHLFSSQKCCPLVGFLNFMTCIS